MRGWIRNNMDSLCLSLSVIILTTKTIIGHIMIEPTIIDSIDLQGQLNSYDG